MERWASALAWVWVFVVSSAAALPARAQLDPELGLGADMGGDADAEGSAEVSVVEGDADPEDARDAGHEAGADEAADSDSGGGNHIEAFRLGLALRLFEFESRTTSVGNADQDTSGVSFGLFPSQLGLNLAFGFAEHFVVGARLQLAVASGSRTSFTGTTSDTSGLSVSVLPYFEYVFTPASTVAWMVFADLGVRSVGLSVGASDVSQTVFVMGLGGGAHIFFSDGASIDADLQFSYSTGGGNDSGTDFDVHGIVLGLELGMSLWL